MKILRGLIFTVMLFTGASQGATTISGVVGTSFKAPDGTTNITTGSLVMIIADAGGGFLDQSKSAGDPGGPSASVSASVSGQTGRTITTAQAGTMAGSNIVSGLIAGNLFGGDVIVTTSLSGTGSIGGIMSSVDITPYVGKNFALVWFNSTPATLAGPGGLVSQYFGMIRLSDWTFPGSDSGATFNMSSTDVDGANSFYSTSNPTTLAQLGAGFFTGSGTAGSTAVRAATFQIVPEPSSVLLAACGALGLLRRRRDCERV